MKRLAAVLALSVLSLTLSGLSVANAQPRDVTGKIVGGSPIAITEVPWQVQIAFRESGSWYSCGGVLIGSDAVLTAAHCATSETDGSALPASDFRVAMGSATYSNTITTTGALVRSVAVHPDWSWSTFQNDIALLRLSSAVSFTDSIAPVTLPTSVDPQTWPSNEASAVISGWGATAYGGSGSATLLGATVDVVGGPSVNDCGIYNTDALAGEYFKEQMLCAGVPSFTIDSCQGDSGGPLTVDVSGTRVLAGLVSWGYQCARPNYPGIYTRVTSYVDWILANTTPIVPTAPRSVVATAGSGRVSASWTAPSSNGGSAITNYTATTSTGQTCTTNGELTCAIEGLTPGKSVTVTVTAKNGIGTSAASAASSAVTPFKVPEAVTSVKATAKNEAFEVSWTAPSDGFSPITSYQVTTSPAGLSCVMLSTTSCRVSKVTNGRTYAVTVAAVNAAGAGAASSAVSVVPVDATKSKGSSVTSAKLLKWSGLKRKSGGTMSWSVASSSRKLAKKTSTGVKFTKVGVAKIVVSVKNPGKKKKSANVFVAVKK